MSISRKAVVSSIQKLVVQFDGILDELNKLAAQLQDEDKVETKGSEKARTDDGKLSADDEQIAPLLAQIQALVTAGNLPGSCQSFTKRYLGNKQFTVDGAMKVLVKAKEAIKEGKGNNGTSKPQDNDDLPSNF